jgi:hypothetical protein
MMQIVAKELDVRMDVPRPQRGTSCLRVQPTFCT